MKYKFPCISHLDEVKKVIDGVDGFIIAERDWGYVANYVQAGTQTFPEVKSIEDAIRRECRGLIFSLNGKLLSRPYHKFFNVGERTETLPENFNLDEPHVILEKLDGSMIRPFIVDDSYRLGTKMGITDVAMQAEVWLADHDNYDKFILDCISNDRTPIFEWCSRKQRIVIDYPTDRLVLTAIRFNFTGEYYNFSDLNDMAANYNLDVVKQYPGTVNNMESLMAETHDLQGQEGWVIRFDDGHMMKLKASEYVTIHKAKDNILREKGVIEMLIDEKSDDVKPFLIEEDRKRVEDYENSFWAGVQSTISAWKYANDQRHRQFSNDNRKGFALEIAPHIDSNLRSAIFKAWDSDPLTYDWRKVVIDCIRKNINTQKKLESARYLWAGARWKPIVEEGE